MDAHERDAGRARATEVLTTAVSKTRVTSVAAEVPATAASMEQHPANRLRHFILTSLGVESATAQVLLRTMQIAHGTRRRCPRQSRRR